MEPRIYWKIPLKQKNPYKWSTIKYNSVDRGPSRNIFWSNSSTKMWSSSKDWKTGYVIKTGPTETFLQNKRSTRISGPQLKIKNQILAYRWTFGKGPLKLDEILWAIHTKNMIWCNDGSSEKVLSKLVKVVLIDWKLHYGRSYSPEI